MKLPSGVLELAVSQALKSPMQHKHGAVIWKKGQIIGAGYNYHVSGSNPKQRQISIHSEKDCLSGLRGDQIYGADILAIRVKKNGSLSHGAPCKGCKKLLKRKGVRKVFWFDLDKQISYTRLN
jgi:deoxycytidylate deaminase